MNITDIISEADELPNIIEQINILDIMKIGHLEKVSSNIIASFINGNTDLSIKYSFIKALAQITGIKIDEPYYHIYAETEVTTNKGKRIDLLIFINDTDLILIENKIYHILNNDLDEYISFIDGNEYYQKYKKHYFVLSLNKINNIQLPFKNIIHHIFCSAVKEFYGKHALQQNAQSLLVVDYCNNILSLSGKGNSMNNSYYVFTQKYYNEIKEIIVKMNTYSEYTNEKVQKVYNFYESNTDNFEKVNNYDIYLGENDFEHKYKAVIFFEFIHDSKTYVIDIGFSLDGLTVLLFCRERQDFEFVYIEKLGEKKGSWIDTNDGKRYLMDNITFLPETLPEEIMDYVNCIIKRKNV